MESNRSLTSRQLSNRRLFLLSISLVKEGKRVEGYLLTIFSLSANITTAAAAARVKYETFRFPSVFNVFTINLVYDEKLNRLPLSIPSDTVSTTCSIDLTDDAAVCIIKLRYSIGGRSKIMFTPVESTSQ